MSGLIVTDLTVAAGGRDIVAAASLTAPPGAVTALIGPNGAGKTTLIRAVLGLVHPASGAIAYDNRPLATLTPIQRAKFCAYVEQSATTSERLTVRDAVALGRIPFQSALQSRHGPTDDAAIAAAVAAIDLAPLAARQYNTLSGGEQQRTQLARALAQEPQLLLLDEPTSHLDIEGQLSVLELLHARARAGCTILLAIHDLNLAARYADHLVVMKSGRILAAGPPSGILTPELIHMTYGVHASIFHPPGSTAPVVVYERPDRRD
jgi:iron complex transport system ATP-binding protein